MWAKGKKEWLKEGGEIGKRSRRDAEEEVGMVFFPGHNPPLPMGFCPWVGVKVSFLLAHPNPWALVPWVG